MKPPPFTYHRPASRDEVDSLLATYGDEAKVLAGGQSLIPILNMRLSAPPHLVDINHLGDEAIAPVRDGDAVFFGPLVRQHVAESSSLVAELVPLLSLTIGHVAHPAIRSRGTISGSIAHADPAAELPAAITVLEGAVEARGSSGKRVVPAAEFFAGPLENSLLEGEWVEGVRWPVRRDGTGYAFEEFARRSGDYALCGVAAVATTAGDGAAVAFSYLGMGDVPVRFETAALTEDDLLGHGLEDAIAALIDEHLDPTSDIHASVEFRKHLGRRLGIRAARSAWRDCRPREGGR